MQIFVIVACETLDYEGSDSDTIYVGFDRDKAIKASEEHKFFYKDESYVTQTCTLEVWEDEKCISSRLIRANKDYLLEDQRHVDQLHNKR